MSAQNVCSRSKANKSRVMPENRQNQKKRYDNHHTVFYSSEYLSPALSNQLIRTFSTFISDLIPSIDIFILHFFPFSDMEKVPLLVQICYYLYQNYPLHYFINSFIISQLYISIITKNCCKTLICESSPFICNRIKVPSCPKGYSPVSLNFSSIVSRLVVFSLRQKIRSRPAFSS